MIHMCACNICTFTHVQINCLLSLLRHVDKLSLSLAFATDLCHLSKPNTSQTDRVPFQNSSRRSFQYVCVESTLACFFLFSYNTKELTIKILIVQLI